MKVSLKVLLVEFDLFRSVGGGQTVYKRLIQCNPEVTFYYFGIHESESAARPQNARLVPYREGCQGDVFRGGFVDLGIPVWAYADFVQAVNVAAAAAQVTADIVDLPDYRCFGYLLGPALRSQGLGSCKVVLSMHGNISETQRVNWGNEGWEDVSMDQREQWQYRAADIRYGLSQDYLEHWRGLGGKPGHYLNPLRFLPPPQPVAWVETEGGVSLNFIGRTEGFKGPDLFVELLTWLPADAYEAARIIGPEIIDRNGVSSTEHLRKMVERRGLPVQILPAMNSAEMARLYATRAITVLTSRMDTFNLTALESLFSGCPTALSNKAGVCRFLRETFPRIPAMVLDLDRLYAEAGQIARVMAGYNGYRQRLIETLAEKAPEPTGPALQEIYACQADPEPLLLRQAAQWFKQIAAHYQRQNTLPHERVTKGAIRVCDCLTPHVQRLDSPEAAQEALRIQWHLYRLFFHLPEQTPRQIDEKLALGWQIGKLTRVDRARVWAELARLERVRGNDFVAATYDVRVLRAQDRDRLGALPLVVSCLEAEGYPREAATVRALYGPRDQRLARCRLLLERARQEHRQAPERPFEFLEDQRASQPPRVSIIVSLYRTGNKLEHFLRMLAQQTLVAAGQTELILIDSHSPTEEYAVFKRMAQELNLTGVYGRTEARETIQTAWNRGILLARAPYLTFLGVDEAVRPNCLAVLADELDGDQGLDWVQGSTVVAEVNDYGIPQRDIMVYQRSPYDQDLNYLDTCYLAYVGGMYRKRVHDRYGYYDESFGAAGDTEFKNRIMPYIRTRTLPRTLGIYLNYPEERTTQSPRAEIEDLRAWYLHRSVAGVEYALSQREPGDALHLAELALSYRKSYCGHVSSDLDFASAVLAFGLRHFSSQAFQECAGAVGRALAACRELDWLPGLSPGAAPRERKRVEQVVAREGMLARSALGSARPFAWTVFNDNRHEQHTCVWQGKALAHAHAPGGRFHWCLSSRSAVQDAEPGAAEAEGIAAGHSTAQGGTPAPGQAVACFVAGARRQAQELRRHGQSDLARGFDAVAGHVEALGARPGSIPPPAGTRAGAVLCEALSASKPKEVLGRSETYDQGLQDLSNDLGQTALQAGCLELADAFAAIAEQTDRLLSQNRLVETARQLLACKTPLEAVRKHQARLNDKLLEIVRGASLEAQGNGDRAYALRLRALADAIQAELAALKARQSAGGRPPAPDATRAPVAPGKETLAPASSARS
jgi:glycosyltransferase involved in cell wall biosynthesis